jgi:hypothetical protein
MYAAQKDVSNVYLTCYADNGYHTKISFEALKECSTKLSDRNSSITFVSPVIELDSYLSLIKGLTQKEGSRWIRFDVKVEDIYQLDNGTDITHSYNIYNLKNLTITHNNTAIGDPGDFIFHID